MRIVHLGDNHLGAGSGQREQDILDSYEEAIDQIIQLKPDLVINAGDLFHQLSPSNRAIAFASRQFIRLGRDAGIPTIIISGNHDAPKQKHVEAVLSIFEAYENVYIIHKSRYERIKIKDCAVSAVPHCLTPEILKEELQKVEPDSSARYNILVLHGVVAGMEEFRMVDLAEQEIDASYFHRGFDYVALGHYHNFKRVEPMVYYCGSTERLSLSEACFDKGFIEIDFDKKEEKEKVIFHQLKTRDMVDLPALTVGGKSAEQVFEELQRKVREYQPQGKIVRIKLTDIKEETYRSLPFDKIAELKREAFSLDIVFEKEKKSGENLYADVNLGRLDVAFEKYLKSEISDETERGELQQIGLQYLRRAESEES